MHEHSSIVISILFGLLAPLAPLVLLGFITLPALAQEKESKAYKAPEDINFRRVNISSEGTRMTGEVFSLKSAGKKKLPTIVMCHGWGNCDGRLILSQPAPKAGKTKEGEFTAKIKHYGIYYEVCKQAQKLAVEWFDEHLKK